MDVICNPDGTITITADPDTAATLAGREQFGDVATAQEQLREQIADAWYAAGCPRP